MYICKLAAVAVFHSLALSLCTLGCTFSFSCNRLWLGDEIAKYSYFFTGMLQGKYEK